MFYLTMQNIYVRFIMVSNIWCMTTWREETCCHHMGTLISSKGFYMHPAKAFITPVMKHWLDRETAQWVQHEGWIQKPIT